MTIRKLLACAALAAASAIAAIAQDGQPQPINRSVLFDRGDMGSTFWRIPALAVANDGTLVAVADKRNDSNRDLPNLIDLAVRTSTDGGRTWSEPRIVVAADSTGGYGDAALGVHAPSGDLVIVAAHGNGLWEATADHPQSVVVMRSSDSGFTWSEPVDITDCFYDPHGNAPLVMSAGFASSGAMHCDSKGRLMFLISVRPSDKLWGPLSNYLCVSDDGGYNWHLVDWIIDDNGDESKVVELADGSYYASIRNRAKTGRKISRSTDGGLHWTAAIPTTQLIDPACNGDLIALTPKQLEDMGLAEIIGDNSRFGLMLHSIADDPKDRVNVSVFASDDLGSTWRKIYTVTEGVSSYSALAVMPDGTLGIFSEEGHPDGGFRLWFTSISLADALKAMKAREQ